MNPSTFVIVATLLVCAHFATAAINDNVIVHSKVHASINPSQVVIPDEAWGYSQPRANAHIFWWLYGSTGVDPSKRANVPLILWLQGGPGASSTGFGNFEEIGPLDDTLNPRNSTWTTLANVLFIDQPVGTGFSYVDDSSAYTTNVTQIANDLVVVFIDFIQNYYPVFETVPFYIFCESYGGKMTTAFAVALREAISKKQVNVPFNGIALGDSWIKGLSYTNTWPAYLYAFNLVDANQLATLNADATAISNAIAKQQWDQATNLWGNMEDDVESVTDNVNFYNVLQHASDSSFLQNITVSPRLRSLYGRHVARYYRSINDDEADLPALMNGPIRQKLTIIPANVTWGGQSNDVFEYQSTDFMKDVVADVDLLLSQGFSVTVYNGQLDLICDTLGTLDWISTLKWSGIPSWLAATKTPLYTQVGVGTQGFLKQYKNFAFYNILMAGHMAPIDNPFMTLSMVAQVIGSSQLSSF